MEETDAIMVARPVYNQFQVILTETHLTSNSLMKHFFQLYNSSVNTISEQKPDNNVICGRKGDNCSKLIVKIPKSLLRRNISVNVNLPYIDQCASGNNDDSSEDSSTAGGWMCTSNRVTDKTKNTEVSHISPLQEPIMTWVANSSVQDSPNTTLSQTYNCNFCTFKTKGLRKFKNHIRKHSIKQLNCHFCEKIFLDQSKLDHHVKTKHANLTMHSDYTNLQDGEFVMEGHTGTKELSEKKSQVFFETQSLTGQNSNSSQVNETEDNALLTTGHQVENEEVNSNSVESARGDNLSMLLQIKTSNGVLYKDFPVLENEHEKNYMTEYHTKPIMRKRFTCRLCEANFENVNLYCNHRNKCSRNMFRFICNCNMKFKWKSVFLHHKINCTASKLTNLTSKNTKYLMLWNGRKCSNNMPKKVNTVFTEMLKHKRLCTHRLKSKECNSLPMEEDKINVNTQEDKITREEHKKEEDNGQHKSSFLKERGENIQEILVSSPLQSSEINDSGKFNSLQNQEIGQTQMTKSADSSMQLPENENMTHCCSDNKTGIQNEVTRGQNNSSKFSVDSWKLNSIGSLHDKEINRCRQESSFDSETGIDFVKQEPIEADDNFSALIQNGEHLSVEKLIEAASFREFSQKPKPNTDADFQNVLNSLSSIDDGEVNLKCEECGESFKRKAYLKEHIEGKHGGGLRYSCDCGKRFKWRSSLGSHRKNCYHGYQAMLSLLPEGQSPSVSVIDFTHCALPYMGMQHEWIQEMQKLTEASIFKGNDAASIFRQDNRQRHVTSPERLKGDDQVQTQKRKSESVSRSNATSENNSTLRIDTSLMQPFVDALAKYQHKSATNILSGKNMASKLGHKTFETEPKSTAATGSSIEKTKVEPSTGVIDLSIEHNLNRKSSSISQNMAYTVHEGNTTLNNVNNRSHLVDKARTGARAKSSDFIQTKEVPSQQRRKSYHFAYTETLECSFCKETFSNEDELEGHKLYCIHLQDTCSVCGKTFQHRTDLVTHLLTCHGSDEAYTCFCDFTSSNWNAFEKHCERCEDFKMQSSNFTTIDKNKKLRSESRPLSDRQHSEENTSQSQESVSDKRFPGNQHLKVNQFTQNLKTQTKPIYNQHFQDNENSPGQDLSLQSVSRSSANHFPLENFMEGQNTARQYNNGTQVTKSMTNMNILPTISSFVTPSTGHLEHFSNTTERIQPGNEQSRSSIDQSKQRDIEQGKNDVFVCTFCGNVYNSLEKFSQHNKIHHPNRTMSPGNKKKSAVDIAINKAHHLTDKIPDHVCHLCGDVFAAKAYLKEHISGKHGAVDRYKCPCGMRFKWRSSLGTHQKKCPSSSERTYNRWTSGLDNNDVDIFKSDLQNVNQSVV